MGDEQTMKGRGKKEAREMSREEYIRIFVVLSQKYNPYYVSYVVWL
jgi:hypothetical protein